jgi:hypothetical protein
MPELELVRTPEDRRRYALDGIGTLRLEGLLGRSASAEAGERSWIIARRGVFTSAISATDAAGTEIGEFTGRTLRRGGTLRWGERTFALQPDSMWTERYALTDGDLRLATIEGHSWGKRPVRFGIDDLAAVEPGLLLFAAFVVRALAEDAQSSTSGGSYGAVT